MNFSLSRKENPLQLNPSASLDVFCDFFLIGSVSMDESLLLGAVCASLRMKHSVLLLEHEILAWPTLDESKMWLVGDNFLWIAPRTLSTITKGCAEKSLNMIQIKKFFLSL